MMEYKEDKQQSMETNGKYYEAEKSKKIAPKNEPNYRGIKAMPFVIGNETFEKLGTLGTSSNLLVYLTSIFHMRTISATNLLNIFNGTCNFGTLIGAYLSDTYFGRYKTLGFASVCSFLGMLILTLTSAVPAFHPPDCGSANMSECKGPTTGQMALLLSAFGLLVIGAGGIRPCNLAFGADQFNPNTESGRKATNSFFNWYYFTYTFSVMVSMTIIVYVQSSISWSIGLAIPTGLMFLSCALFFGGTWLYIRVLPQGSPLASVVQVFVVAVKKRGLKPQGSDHILFNYIRSDFMNTKLPHTEQFRFLDKAAIMTPEDKINPDGSIANPWNLCSSQQVEEVKCLMRLIPLWFSSIVFFISIIQLQNYVVFQALQSDRRLPGTSFDIPAATFNVFSMLALTVWIPIYDRIIVPVLTKYTKKEGGITMLQRMGIGIFLSALSMLTAGIVETRRKHWALTRKPLGIEPRKGVIASMSTMWLVPQLALSGVSEGFTYIAQNELFYREFPENMRSIATAIVACGVAASSYLCTGISSIIQNATKKGEDESWLAQDLNKGNLDYFYYFIAGLEALNLVYFLFCSRWYRYKGTSKKNDDEISMEKLQSEKSPV